MAQIDGGDLVARMLKREGIDVIFTLSGGHIQNIYDGCLDEGIDIIDVRHEQVAGHAAEAYSRLTGKCGVAIVTAGPGVTDAITAVATAYQNGSPMLLIGGAAPDGTAFQGNLQEIPGTIDMFKPITKWSATCHVTKRIPDYLAQAFRVALSGRYGPVFLELPADVLFGRMEESEARLPEGYRTEGRLRGDPKLIAAAAQALAKAERPLVMGGSGTYWSDAGQALAQLAERLDAPLYLNDMGRGCVSQEHPLFFNRSRRLAFESTDVAIFVGVPMDFRLAFGRSINKEAKVIAIDGQKARLELARRMGADETIDMADYPTAEARIERVRELTGGLGADLTVGLVGFAAAFHEALQMLRSGGRHLEIGSISQVDTVSIAPAMIVSRRITVIGVGVYDPWIIPKVLDFMVRTKDRYPYHEIVSNSYPLAEISRAFREAEWKSESGEQSAVTRALLVP